MGHPTEFPIPAPDADEVAAICDAANRAATFLPRVDDDTLPCLIVAGVQVYVYLDPTIGALHISVDLDTAQIARPDGTVPILFDVGSATVFDDSEAARSGHEPHLRFSERASGPVTEPPSAPSWSSPTTTPPAAGSL